MLKTTIHQDVVFIILGAFSLVWDNSSLKDGATVNLYEWQDLQIDWSYTLEPNEWLRSATWLLLLQPTRYNTLASQDGTALGQPFYVRKFYWGVVR